MKHKLLLIYSWFVRILMFLLPDIPFLMRFRGFLYGLGMNSCGYDFQVTHDAIIKDLENISVGNNSFIANGVIILAAGPVYIGNKVLIGPHVIIVSGNHTSVNKSYRYGKSSIGPIYIGDGSWVAGNCTIQKDTKLPPNSVLSANSFLNKTFEDESAVYGGVPAVLLRKNI